MSTEHSLVSNLYAQLLSTKEHSPVNGEYGKTLNSYLLAIKVEGKSPLTIILYRQRIGNFFKFAINNQFPTIIKKLTTEHLRLFFLSLQQSTLKPTTINAYYRQLHTFFEWLRKERVIKESPMTNIKSPPLPETKPVPFKLEDVQNLLDLTNSRNRFYDIRNRAMFLMLMDTAVRLFELQKIQLKDIDHKRRTIKVIGKKKKERLVTFSKETHHELLHYLLERTDSYPDLWVKENRTPITLEGIKIDIRRECKRAGITGVKLGAHTFRHTAAISCLRNGMELCTLQNMMGHAKMEMTRHYCSSLNDDDLIKAHETASPVANLYKNHKQK